MEVRPVEFVKNVCLKVGFVLGKINAFILITCPEPFHDIFWNIFCMNILSIDIQFTKNGMEQRKTLFSQLEL